MLDGRPKAYGRVANGCLERVAMTPLVTGPALLLSDASVAIGPARVKKVKKRVK